MFIFQEICLNAILLKNPLNIEADCILFNFQEKVIIQCNQLSFNSEAKPVERKIVRESCKVLYVECKKSASKREKAKSLLYFLLYALAIFQFQW